ncbi:hypothetical protein GGD55_002315 [Rhizobium giardinii]|uniref:Uncharacterized protein n=1 Tax=Rhizobium giardinii TaxID=56731 RepID=A0A7W8X8F5_9HYPH|nr:hypothetical protein [Rhizobium giardinii]
MVRFEHRFFAIEISVAGSIVLIEAPATTSRAERRQMNHHRAGTLDGLRLIHIGASCDADSDRVTIVSDEVDPPTARLVLDTRVDQVHVIPLSDS